MHGKYLLRLLSYKTMNLHLNRKAYPTINIEKKDSNFMLWKHLLELVSTNITSIEALVGS